MSEIKISRGKITINGKSKPVDKVFDKICDNYQRFNKNVWHDPKSKMVSSMGMHAFLSPKRAYIVSYKQFIASYEKVVIDAFDMID